MKQSHQGDENNDHDEKKVESSEPSKYRMVALDLDGTLLGPDHQLSSATIEYMRYLHDKGFIISIATGRSAACTFDQVAHLNLSFPGSKWFSHNGIPVVCSNGARGVHVQPIVSEHPPQQQSSEKDLGKDYPGNVVQHQSPYAGPVDLRVTDMFHEPILASVAQKVIQYAVDMGHLVQYYVGHDIYANPTTESQYKLCHRYTDLTGKKQVFCDNSFKEAMQLGPPSKLLVICGPEPVDMVTDALSKSLQNEANIVRGSPAWFVEVLHPSVCKGTGLKQMAKLLNVDTDEIVAFGDGDNDLEFLQYAGLGIAMKNARENVKQVADEVCLWTNAEDGVIRTLQKMEEEGLLHFPTCDSK